MTLFNRRKISRQLTASDNAKTSDKRGDILECLTVNLFTAIAGIRYLDKNVLDGDRSKEIDVVFLNDFRNSELFFLKEPYIVVECKNWKKAIGSSEVATFIAKLRDSHFSCGILISLSGITGSPTKITSAYSIVYNSFIRDGITVILIDRADILSFKTIQDFVELLLKRHSTLILRKSFS